MRSPTRRCRTRAATGGIINLPAVLLVLLCTLLLIRGASESATVNAIMVVIKLGVLAMFIVIGLHRVQRRPLRQLLRRRRPGISAAAGTIFFSFIGLDAVATAGEEVQEPAEDDAASDHLRADHRHRLLRAGGGRRRSGAQPASEFSPRGSSEAGLAKILEHITGIRPGPERSSPLGAVISIFSVTLVTLYGQTRILFAMGRDGMSPKQFAAVNPRTLTPMFNTVVVAIVVALVAGFVPLRLPVGQRLDRHPGRLHRRRDRGDGAAPDRSPTCRAAFKVPLLPGDADPDRPGLPVRALTPAGQTWIICLIWLVIVFSSTCSTGAGTPR